MTANINSGISLGNMFIITRLYTLPDADLERAMYVQRLCHEICVAP